LATILESSYKKRRKKECELNWVFQEVWVAKLPWVEVVVGCDGKFNMACCKICNELNGREKVLVPKFDSL
jgi:hypothetical protein